MSQVYYYLSTLPEALIASMLPPEKFASYLAVGKTTRARGAAMLFEVDAPFESNFFDFNRAEKECVEHNDEQPKHSVYLGIYRVLEHTPLDRLKALYLATNDGRVLRLDQQEVPTSFEDGTRMYAELCPVNPLVVSSLNPKELCEFMTADEQPLHLPKICFVDIETEAWMPSGTTSGRGSHARGATNHVVSCIHEVQGREKKTKMVDRTHIVQSWDMDIRNGFFLGDGEKMLYYPFPSKDELEKNHHNWWRSACV